ncbi:MAG: hypothetical protein K6G33_10890 [Ruminococcus sp.]|uniref:hypothetical protein n=1 Tax=Ruminococcus sp. TaxID=41978 RepID=UPI0025D5D800|nr:hypothetical protein [Ruminococcus sp.]MCR5601231.1 hypothetical protein [Ruminococcus sp.]
MRKSIATLAFIAAFALTGCGSVTQSANVSETTTAATTQAATETTTTSDNMKLIGDRASGNSVCLLTVSNKTNKDIVSISVKSDIDKDYSANMINEKDPFVKNEKRLMYFIPEKQETITYEDSEHVATMGYTIKIEFSDKKSVELHQFPFKEIEYASLFIEGDVAYLEYTTKDKGEKVSTKEAEKMFSENEPATQAETEAATEAQANNNNNNNNNNEPVYNPAPSYEEPVYQEPVYTQPTTEYVAPATQAPAPVVTDPPAAEPTTANPNSGCSGWF